MEEEWYRNCKRFSTGEDGCDETYLGLAGATPHHTCKCVEDRSGKGGQYICDR